MIKQYPAKLILFSLFLTLFTLGTGTTALSAVEPAGVIALKEGVVEILRNGKSLTGKEKMEIFSQDEIKTGAESMVELSFKDGSSLHLGPESTFSLTQYKFGLTDEKPSFLGKMAKGIFVYISGVISKVNPGSVKFETPDATIGIRGTKIVVIVTSNTIVINFKDPNGKVGTVTISNNEGTTTLNQELHHVVVTYEDPPSVQQPVDETKLREMIHKLLEGIVFGDEQGLGYTDPESQAQLTTLFNELNDFLTDPENLVSESASAPLQ
jgi:hypothetical protein